MMRITPRSLPGIVLEENRNRSPSFNSSSHVLTICQLSRGGTTLPLRSCHQQHKIFTRHLARILRTYNTRKSPLKRPVSIEASIIATHRTSPAKLLIALPGTPASANVFTRATFEANVVGDNYTIRVRATQVFQSLVQQSPSERPRT